MPTLALLEGFGGLCILVVGEAMLDSYLHGNVARLCREAPVPIVAMGSRQDTLGGAANTAAGIRALGATVDFLSVIGDDDAGQLLRRALGRAELHDACVFTAPGRATLTKQRVMGNGQLLLRLDEGSEEPLDETSERRLLDALAERWTHADAVVISDYDYGILTPAVVGEIERLQRAEPRVLVADAKDLTRYARAGVTAAKPNYAEAIALAGVPCLEGRARLEQIVAAEDHLLAVTGAQILCVTLDVTGAIVFERGREAYRTFTRPSPHIHAAGAGDVFTGAFALALAAGAHTPAAADLASAAATVSVAEPGTTVCSAALIREHLAGERKVATTSAVTAQVEGWRAAGRRVVFTNGCFDILHRGHITYLNRAKALGDVLVVGLNADSSVKRLKGTERPINDQDDRASVIAALSCVDLVVVFEEDTPVALIEALRPDIYAKGGDYTLETLPEAPVVKRLGGEVKLLDFLEDRSTSGIIDRIRQNATQAVA